MNFKKSIIILCLGCIFGENLYAQGVQTFQSIRFFHPNNPNQFVTLIPPSSITSYGLTLPATQGAANTVFLNDGSGNMSFDNGNGIFWRLIGNSASNPAIHFIGTTDAQDLVFRTNNTEKVRILTGGNVGIGVTSPSFKLDVNGTGLFRNGNGASTFASDQLLFSWNGSDQYRHAIKSRHNAGATTDNALDFYLWKQGTDVSTTTGTLQVMTLQGNNNGSVGIGTTNPQNVLHINNLSAAGDAIKVSNVASGSTLLDGFDMNHVGLTTNFILNQKENAEFRFGTNNIQRATFMGDGKYAIGPAFSAPSEGFHYQWQNAIFEADDNQSAMISGYLGLKNLNDAAYELRFYEPDGCGQNYSAFKAQNQLSNLIYTLPSLAPAVNDVLSVTSVTAEEVSLSWITPGGGGGGSPVTGTGTPGEIAFWATPTGISSDSRLYWDDATLRFGVGTATPDDMVDVQGNVFITNGSTAASKLKFGEPNYVGGGNFTSFEAQTQAADVAYTLPAAGPVSATTGTNAYALLTNSIGNTATLEWQPVWATTGNAGVSTGFLGTTDAQPLIVRTNNVEQFRLLSSGEMGIGTILPTHKLELSNGNFGLTNTGTAAEIRLFEPSASGANYSAFKAQAQTANVTYTLPSADGTANQVLATNGSGILSWAAATSGTTNMASVSTNTLTSTVNGVAATASVVTGVSNTSSVNNIRTTVNGVAGSNVSIINSNTLGMATNTLTSTINGVAATANVVTSVSNTSSSNNLSTSINGVTGSNVSIINSNALSISTTNLTSTINGVASTALDIKPAIKTVAWSKDGNGSTSPGTDFIGTTDAQDLVFKTAGSEAFRINTSQNIGIGVTAPNVKIEMDGAIAFKANTAAVTADNQVITVGNRTYVKLNSDGTLTNRTITLSNGLSEGQLLFISIIATGVNGIEINDAGNINLNSIASLGNGDTLQLLWDGTTWNEITRSNN